MWTNSLLDGMISCLAVACALLYGFVYACGFGDMICTEIQHRKQLLLLLWKCQSSFYGMISLNSTLCVCACVRVCVCVCVRLTEREMIIIELSYSEQI
jgi:hypothetical protein